ncbi:copper resistance protein B [Neptunomonas qingdaonensis]|uniref:Copper resistance protein B n=1 Tax=Neptunomonas qingdaonensis TaxID=1045558 RepID=A0A1I2SUV8_9GAMM|nr:copper resistance protein B [Neptunomonas qingdaonensis]SFG53691.1 copper resistance protein B [Neptunomonas qingdaonensis]
MKRLSDVDALKPLTILAMFAMISSPLLAQAEIRDPHAYSNGYTLEEGPYALAGPRLLKLADEHKFWAIQGNRVEYDADSENGVFEIQGWYGSTYERLVIKFDGDVANGRLQESQTGVVWSHAYSTFFDTQWGVRLDHYDAGTDRQWISVGFQGLAPYWFELEMTAYLGESGRTAISLAAEYELLLSQRLVLHPSAELSLYGKNDVENRLGEGLSDASLGLRLRYEITRQFAPYVGVEWTSKLGKTADIARAADESIRDTRYVVGMRFWL